MSDDDTKPEIVKPEPLVPEGKTLRIYQRYEAAARCLDCGTRLTVKCFDGMPPKGHDDNQKYQEVVLLGVGRCERCSIKVVGLA